MSEPTYAATADFAPDFEIGANAERPRAAFLVCMPRFTNPAWLSMWLTTNFTAAFCDPTLHGVSIERLDDLRADRMMGNVARYTQEQPRGSYVSNSNTEVVLAKGAVEHATNAEFHGVPVGTELAPQI